MSVPNGFTSKEWSNLHGKAFTDESRTRQEFKDECDINNIMKQYHRTGMIAHVREHMGAFMDLSDGPDDFTDAQQKIVKATEFFMGLPSNIRARFLNNTGEFLDFISNPDNLDEMAELGLIPAEPKEPAEPAKPEAKPEANAPGAPAPAGPEGASEGASGQS